MRKVKKVFRNKKPTSSKYNTLEEAMKSALEILDKKGFKSVPGNQKTTDGGNNKRNPQNKVHQ